jgi:hypothetical protein
MSDMLGAWLALEQMGNKGEVLTMVQKEQQDFQERT